MPHEVGRSAKKPKAKSRQVKAAFVGWPAGVNGYSTHGNGNYLFRRHDDSQYRRHRPQCLEDIAKQIPQYHQRALISDARYIYASGGGQVAGAVHKKADYVVGAAWKPQYTGESPDWKKLAETWADGWTKICEIRGGPFNWKRCLWLASVAF